MNTKEFAQHWLKSWNDHNIEAVLSHFSDDVQVTTPMIKIATGRRENTLHGKESLREYWSTALNKFPDLHFELICITEGVNSVALFYKSVLGKKAIEVLYFNQAGLVDELSAFYSIESD
ncbi:nuclear transport factor 2 family protein [Arcticibacter sp.]|jgi:hypothetical protein|uniref:nuclear transport factor 2 family protein n=1 Tax=Arcticibacter sp. TaxID=1872630 RepID=UPI00388D748B